MPFLETDIPGVLIIEPRIFQDNRGSFFESYNQRVFFEGGVDTVFVQDNQAFSRRGVIRALHYQIDPHAQAKLVRVLSGVIFDVAVDIRHGSPTFGKWVGVELSGENHRQLFVPKGFAHGYSVLTPEAVIFYKCDNYYHPASERGIRFDDPMLRIDWKVPIEHQILNDRDRSFPLLRDVVDLPRFGEDS
ncbi:MAG: dTDP-4-dehydrorhamnose 3,5-epimerase [Marinilabiliales bacterium]|nr:dTDP-4-dehydrorhamnose 3,5-epimerase [Marinilabiliales bacterium]